MYVEKLPKKIAKKMIEKYHYSHAWTSCRYALGLFYKTDNEHTFFDQQEEKLIGTAVYGYPVGRLSAQSISEKLEPSDVLELTRLFIHDGYGKNAESFFISKTIQWLKENTDIKALMSYDDPIEGHLGGIYQATNWIYQGDKIRYCDSYLFRLEENGDWIHPRTIFAQYGTNDIETLKKKIGHTFWMKEEPRKHRYIYILTKSKRKRKEIINNLKHPSLLYPKLDSLRNIEIKKVEVDEKSFNV